MGTIWVKEFTGGLDSRRMPEATAGGVLVRGNNGHITRGGEFEQRAAFVPTYALPAGTVGMSSTPQGITVFGHLAAPGGLPVGVLYQRLQHPVAATALVRIRSSDLYAGKLYVVGEFADGSLHHFYDGVRVTDWFDGRSRATFTVANGAVTPAVAAIGSFEVTTGASGGVDKFTSVLIDGTNILGTTINHTGNNATTAAAIAAQITSNVSAPDYTATADGQTVNIVAAIPGTAPNGKGITVGVAGAAAVGNVVPMHGGVAQITATLVDLKVNGVSIIAAPVLWATSNEATATAIAAAVNSHTSVPDYTASVTNASVSLAAATPGAGPNGFVVDYVRANGLVITPATLVMADGATAAGTFQPGSFVRTIGQKVYSVSGPNMHFSGIKAPTKWTTATVGAGFIDLSSESSGAEELMGIARYQNLVAVFAERVVQVWYVDPDPALNRQGQMLNNTGTSCPRSISTFGDTDVFYLDESGLRSLRARDSSNAAATTDIGVPVDDLITAKLGTLDDNERRQVVSLIEPINGRFWLVMRDQIFVFSFFNGAKVSAWSTYDASYIGEGGETFFFDVDYALAFKRRVYLRSGDTIFVYGGLPSGRAFDATVAEAWLPYLDANDPTRSKEWHGLDLAMRGQWAVSAAYYPEDEPSEDLIGIYDKTTYASDSNPFTHQTTHVSLRFRSKGVGPHRLGACVIHYAADEDDD